MATFLISAGGTGGGVYPALSVAEALREPDSPSLSRPLHALEIQSERGLGGEVNLHYIGSVGGMERDLIAHAESPFQSYDEVQSGPLHGVPLTRVVISLFKLALGTLQALRLIGRYRPDALFLTGGWVTFPVAFACWLRRIPIAIFLPDIEPGLAIKALSRLARVVYATTADSAAFFPPGKVIETGYPLRTEVLSATREQGIAHFGLDPMRRTLLVFGGSRGAKSINQALTAILTDLLSRELQIIHISGELDWPNVQTAYHNLPPDLQARYHIFPYLHAEMGLALAAADLVVSRAGASTLGEFPYFGLPAILVPYPFAWRYQKVNADWLVERGAALRLNDEAMAAELLPMIRGLFDDSVRLDAMKQAAKSLARPNSAAAIAQRLTALARTR